MKFDPRRALLGLQQTGALTEDAIRAAYWQYVSVRHPSKGGDPNDFEEARRAKRELLAEVGVRVPGARKTPR